MRKRLVAMGATLLITPVLLAACGDDESGGQSAAAGDRGCVESYDPDTDYFPVKSTVEYATNFTITYEKNYQVLTVKQPYPDGDPESYVLVRCGTPAPELTGELADAQRIEVPITSLYSESTTHLPLLADLGRIDVLTGVADSTTVVNADVRRLIDEGKVVQYATAGQIDTERVVAGDPDVLMTGGMDVPEYATLRDAGIGVVANAEWLEDDPLGRAEWVKFMAALLGEEARATEVFDQIEADYQATAAKVPEGEPIPVLLGSVFQGTWYMPTGNRYIGRLLADAGATYPWADVTGTESLQLDFETVFTESGDARIWLTDRDWATLADATAEDPRYGEFTAAREGEVWTYGVPSTPEGGIDYWERGVTRPDLILGDLVAILHPETSPDHEFAFYSRVER